MESSWSVCTNENDPNHKVVMARCPATCANVRGDPCPGNNQLYIRTWAYAKHYTSVVGIRKIMSSLYLLFKGHGYQNTFWHKVGRLALRLARQWMQHATLMQYKMWPAKCQFARRWLKAWDIRQQKEEDTQTITADVPTTLDKLVGTNSWTMEKTQHVRQEMPIKVDDVSVSVK